MGMLSALCNEVDTFHLFPLNPGLYSYVHTMNSGFGMPDCKPGAVPDDVDSISFEVTLISNIKQSLNNTISSIYPNPSKGSFNLVWNIVYPVELFLYDLNGKLIHMQFIQLGGNNINTVFSPGIYFAKLFGKNEFSLIEKIIVNYYNPKAQYRKHKYE